MHLAVQCLVKHLLLMTVVKWNSNIVFFVLFLEVVKWNTQLNNVSFFYLYIYDNIS